MIAKVQSALDEKFHAWLCGLVKELDAKSHRHVLVVSGAERECLTYAQAILDATGFSRAVWVGERPQVKPRFVEFKQVTQILGEEYQAVIYCAHDGFDVNAWAAVSGTLRGGGIAILLTPPIHAWSQNNDLAYQRLFASECLPREHDSAFIRRFISFAKSSAGIHFIKLPVSDDCWTGFTSDQNNIAEYAHFDQDLTEQDTAVEAVVHVVTGHRRRPVVLMSDRGRGKSAALGIACAQLIQQGIKRILVTAPRLDALASLFKHAALTLPGCIKTQAKLAYGDACIEFMAPDELLRTQPVADCLMVDEAAALSHPMLEMMLQRYARLVFATTVHGYEGSGRGFALRFFKTLDHITPDWSLLTMSAPIRWASHDPLEAFNNHALMLSADLDADLKNGRVDLACCRISRISSDELLADEALLKQVYALLLLAHYRTRPNDLRQLLDSRDVSIYVTRDQQRVVAVLLLLDEGQLATDIEEQVYLGQRRLPGQLLAQTLVAHLGVPSLEGFRFARIMRIAVHPQLHNQGLGSQLLSSVVEDVKQRGEFDMVGTSFSMTNELYPFWQRVGFTLVRLGLTREHTSGCHSAVMLLALTQSAQHCVQYARQRFMDVWPFLLKDDLSALPTPLVSVLSVPGVKAPPQWNASQWREVEAFAYGNRGYEMTLPLLERLVNEALSLGLLVTAVPSAVRDVLIYKTVQHKTWTETARLMGLAGKKQTICAYREAISCLLECLKSNRMLERS